MGWIEDRGLDGRDLGRKEQTMGGCKEEPKMRWRNSALVCNLNGRESVHLVCFLFSHTHTHARLSNIFLKCRAL